MEFEEKSLIQNQIHIAPDLDRLQAPPWNK